MRCVCAHGHVYVCVHACVCVFMVSHSSESLPIRKWPGGRGGGKTQGDLSGVTLALALVPPIPLHPCSDICGSHVLGRVRVQQPEMLPPYPHHQDRIRGSRPVSASPSPKTQNRDPPRRVLVSSLPDPQRKEHPDRTGALPSGPGHPPVRPHSACEAPSIRTLLLTELLCSQREQSQDLGWTRAET